MVISITLLMFSVEANRDISTRGHVEFIALSAIAQIKTAFEVNVTFEIATPSFSAKFFQRFRLKPAKFLFQPCLRKAADESPEQGARVIFDHIADQNSKSRKRARSCRNHHGRNRHCLRQFTSVQTSRASKRHQSKFTRIVAALDGSDTQSSLHVCIYHAHNTGRKLLHAQARTFLRTLFLVLLLKPLRCNPPRSFDIECELAAQEALG